METVNVMIQEKLTAWYRIALQQNILLIATNWTADNH